MTAFRRSPCRRAPLRTAAATALAAACCLAVPVAGSTAAVAADGGGTGSPDTAAAASLLAEPGTHVLPKADTPELPSGISALSWLVSDARTGQVLAAKD